MTVRSHTEHALRPVPERDRSTLTVLQVYKDVNPDVPGGIERHVDDLRRHVRGVTMNVLVSARQGQTRVRTVDGGMEVAAWQVGRALSAPLAPSFPLWARRMPADIVHVHLPNPIGELSVLLANRRVPLVATYHADIVRQAPMLPLYAPLVHAVLRRAAVVLVSTSSFARSSRLLAPHADRVRVVPLGVDVTYFDATAADPAAVRRLRERFGDRVVISTGRLVYYKGYERLIRMAHRLGASLVIVGTGPLEEKLRAMAASLPYVHLLGRVDDGQLRDALAAADVFVLPSVNRAETYGISTVEAQAMGLPAVVTDVGTGTADTIVRDRTGVVVPAGDDDAMVAALTRLLDDPSLRASFGRAARERVVEELSVDRMAARVGAIYRELAGGTPA